MRLTGGDQPRRHPGSARRPAGRSALMALLRLRILVGLAFAAALAACGSSALYGVPGAEPPASTPTLVPGSRPYNVSGLIRPAGGKFLGGPAPRAPGSLWAGPTFAPTAGAPPHPVAQHAPPNNPP